MTIKAACTDRPMSEACKGLGADTVTGSVGLGKLYEGGHTGTWNSRGIVGYAQGWKQNIYDKLSTHID